MDLYEKNENSVTVLEIENVVECLIAAIVLLLTNCAFDAYVFRQHYSHSNSLGTTKSLNFFLRNKYVLVFKHHINIRENNHA
jgi:hypothetical protein